MLSRLTCCAASLAALLCAQLAPVPPPIPPCANSANCNALGTAALKAGNFKAAIADFFEELSDAEDGEGDVALAFNNLTVAYLHQRNFLQARFWVQQALKADPNSRAATANLGTVGANLRSFRWPSSVNGTYVLYIGCGRWDEIRIDKASSSAAIVSFRGIRLEPRGCHTLPAATGELDGEIALHGKSGLYVGSGETGSCKIHLQFRDAGLSVEEDGQCGFGSGVHANEGEYQRISVR